MTIRKVARSSTSGRFVSITYARRYPRYTVIETMKYPSRRLRGVRR
ncbi:MAG TPA: hypothetical protein VKB93_15335 [Thermoanaerobaculia bacterium]|nr:hypothetical protein [Thermoanaerobaculia bacterium]